MLYRRIGSCVTSIFLISIPMPSASSGWPASWKACSIRRPRPTPYNIEKRDHDSYLITVAVAGFDRNELELETENGTLKVKGRKVATMGERQFLHQGIAERDFELAFKLSQHVEVQGARLEHGLLTIELARSCRKTLKPRAIPSANPISWHCPVKQHR